MSPAEATPAPTGTSVPPTTSSPSPDATSTPGATTQAPVPSPSGVLPGGPVPTVTATRIVTLPAEPPSPVPTVTVTVGSVSSWASPPASAAAELPWGLVLSAVLVLAAAVAATTWLVRARRPVATAVEPIAAPAPPSDAARPGLLELLVRLGEAMLDAVTPSGQVNDDLLEVARVNGVPDAEVVSLPTALLVSLPGVHGTQTAAASAGTRSLRLDQVQTVLEVAERAQAGRLTPAEGVAQLASAVASPPPYGFGLRLTGHVALSAGLALILGGGWLDLAVAAALGALVAIVLRLTERVSPGYSALVALGSAFLVSSAAFLLARTGLDLVPLASLVPPLVTFLPGGLLTTAAIDLATGQMVAGAARLAAGGMQLVLLALGITAGAGLVGVPAALAASGSSPIGLLGPWIGVLLFGVGVGWHNGARPGSRRWILLVLLVAYAGQVLGGALFGGAVSAFVGALVMTPVAVVASTRPTGPPAMVTFLPGFWLLVPGALGLVGVTTVLGQNLDAAMSAVVTASTTMVTISLGVLSGLAVSTPLARRLRRGAGGGSPLDASSL